MLSVSLSDQELLSSLPTEKRELHQCLCDQDQYIITFLSPQWRYQGTVQPHRPAILEKKGLARSVQEKEERLSEGLTQLNRHCDGTHSHHAWVHSLEIVTSLGKNVLVSFQLCQIVMSKLETEGTFYCLYEHMLKHMLSDSK